MSLQYKICEKSFVYCINRVINIDDMFVATLLGHAKMETQSELVEELDEETNVEVIENSEENFESLQDSVCLLSPCVSRSTIVNR